MSALLPCPFCGEKRIFLNEPQGSDRGSINCPACLVVMPGEVSWPKGRDELVACWNTRAEDCQSPDQAQRPGDRA